MEWSEHFVAVESWNQAAKYLQFRPRIPADTAGFELDSLAVHVMDHRRRELPVGERSFEAHYGAFVIDQKRAGSSEEARRLALETSYGLEPVDVTINGSAGRRYPLGAEVPDDDVDGRSAAIVVWSVDDLVCLVASSELDDTVLVRIARSVR